MANEQEIREIKESIIKLEAQVAELKAGSRGARSNLARFGIGFLIVFVMLIISVGVIQFIG
ncbi:hypothetical protein [Paenibacillus sp. LPE1-1-1.1]|uniref:hypothetical protein n=1 Tax=Paenibacillus sp. LPE1-1-1.1 TaxID=3135230 RepID=UPI0034277063